MYEYRIGIYGLQRRGSTNTVDINNAWVIHHDWDTNNYHRNTIYKPRTMALRAIRDSRPVIYRTFN